MIRNRILRHAARLVIGALIAAYALVAMHVNAAVPATHAPAVAAADEHCNAAAADTALLLCKHHCQCAVQTLDHPHADLPPMVDAPVLRISLFDGTHRRRDTAAEALRPDLRHHGGAPPPYAGTSRLRL